MKGCCSWDCRSATEEEKRKDACKRDQKCPYRSHATNRLPEPVPHRSGPLLGPGRNGWSRDASEAACPLRRQPPIAPRPPHTSRSLDASLSLPSDTTNEDACCPMRIILPRRQPAVKPPATTGNQVVCSTQARTR